MPEFLLFLPMYVAAFLFGIVIGSFLNVCIYRIPKKENIAKVRSHCMSCGYRLAWYDLVPLFSYLCLRGKCRKCGAHLSVQYPLIEAANGLGYVLILAVNGVNIESLLYMLLFSALLALSVIDFRTYEIPVGFNIFIGFLGLVRLITDYRNWLLYVIGAVSVSLFLYVLYLVSRGRAIGGGDIKLMAACGLLTGWKCSILAFCIGCVLGGFIHLIRMKVSHKDRVLAMGPYLSAGVMISALWGEEIISWYLAYCGF